MLASIGCGVAVAEDGPRALTQIAAVLPDVIFMNIRMPDMDGKETAREIWKRIGRGRVKLVAISASVFDHERQEYLADGFDDFIGKPFRFDAVCACLRQHLRIEFEGAQETPASDNSAAELNLAAITLPAVVLAELREAASRYSVTRLEQGLADLERTTTEGWQLAAHCRRLIERGDLDAVIAFLEKIQSV